MSNPRAPSSLAALTVALATCAAIPTAFAAVPTVTLHNGITMPAISAGTWQYNDSTAFASVQAALSVGFDAIDDAADYKNQAGTGRAIASSGIARADLFITSKVPGCGLQGVSRGNCGPDSAKVFQQSLIDLNVSYVDLLLVHFPPVGGCGWPNCGIIQKQWQALEPFVASKQVRALGVSNWCQSCFECLDKIPGGMKVQPTVNQIQFHIGDGPDPEGLVSYCKSRSVVVEAYSPLGDNTGSLIHGNLTTSIGKKYNKSSVQVALRWIWQHGHPLTTKSANPAHLKDDIDIFSWELSQEDMAQLDAATSPSYKPSFMCTS